jgi:hypothetical protein
VWVSVVLLMKGKTICLVLAACHTLEINPKDDCFLDNNHHGNLNTYIRTNYLVK